MIRGEVDDVSSAFLMKVVVVMDAVCSNRICGLFPPSRMKKNSCVLLYDYLECTQ